MRRVPPHRRIGGFFLPILLIALSAETRAQNPYLPVIQRWVDQDLQDPEPRGAVLAVGSSSIRLWERLAQDLREWDVIQRGFGGSQFSDLNEFVESIVTPYAPAAILVFEGTNDIASGRTAAQVFAQYQSFVSLVRAGQAPGSPATPILYIGITPTPARWTLWPIASQANSLIASFAASDPSLHYIDTPSLFLATGAPPASHLFLSDGLHLTQAGYDLWTQAIHPVLRGLLPPAEAPRKNRLHPGTGACLFFDFGPSDGTNGNPTGGPDLNGNHWNDWFPLSGNTSMLAGEHKGALLDSTGTDTGIGWVITGEFSNNGILNGGLMEPSPLLLGQLAIESATQDYFFGDDEFLPSGFYLRGLDPLRSYELELFASRNTTQTRITRYIVTGRGTSIRELQTSGSAIGGGSSPNGNVSTIASFEGVRPDPRGRLFIDLERVAGDWAYLAAMKLVVGPARVRAATW